MDVKSSCHSIRSKPVEHCSVNLVLIRTAAQQLGHFWSSRKLGPARPTSLKTIPARPKIRPGQEDVKSWRRLIKGDRRRLLRNYVVVRRRREHAQSNPATKVNDRCVDPEVGGPDP